MSLTKYPQFTQENWYLIEDDKETFIQAGYKTVATVNHFVEDTEDVLWPICKKEVASNANLIVKSPELFESHSYLLDAVKRLSEGKPIRDLDERILRAEKLVKEVLEGEK